MIGWFIIRPVNAVLGWFFRGFNRGFDRMTALYGATVGRMLRLSVVVLVVYGGLLALTYWQFTARADRLHSAAGQGLSDPQRADCRTPPRSSARSGSWPQIEAIGPRSTPGVASTRSASPASR